MKALGVGSQKAEAAVLWLGKLGIRDNKEHQLTRVGSLLVQYDPHLDDDVTLWLLHYQLASNPDAEVWYLLTNEFLPNHSEFRYADAVNFLVSKGIRSVKDKHLRADVSIFLRSFTSEEALGRTGLVEQRAGHRNISQAVFCKKPPLEISPYLAGYVMFNQRLKESPSLVTITIDELLMQNGNVGKVFCLSRTMLYHLLRLTSSAQYGALTEIFTTAGLDQIALRFKGEPSDILEMHYRNRWGSSQAPLLSRGQV